MLFRHGIPYLSPRIGNLRFLNGPPSHKARRTEGEQEEQLYGA